MEKLPETFSKMFLREGVVYAVDQLILANNQNTATQVASVEKDNNSASGASSRTRRYRRRSGNMTSEGSSLDENKNPVSGGTVPQGSVEVPSINSNLRTSVSACANAFKTKYFPLDPGDVEVGVTDDLLRLKNLCAKLNAGIDVQKSKSKGKSKASGSRIDDIITNKEQYLTGVISEMLVELGKDDGVSTFEFIGSGVVGVLLDYFSCGYFSKGRILEAELPKIRQQVLKRFKSFVSVALSTSINEGTVAPMTVLVQKLQSALSSLERFPVVLSHSSRSSSGSARLSSGLSVLSQPFKLRLCRAHGEKLLRDYSSNIVLIDPLASLAAVEEFLWPRVQRSEGQKLSVSGANSDSGTTPPGTVAPSGLKSTPNSTTCRYSTRSRSSMTIGERAGKELSQDKSTSKGKGKAILKPAWEEKRGLQTRSSTRRRAAVDKDAQMKPVNGETTSEVFFHNGGNNISIIQ